MAFVMLGIDIYQEYNDITDWTQLIRDGVRVVWVKVTDGEGRAIVAADTYIAAAKNVGLPVGGYHFAEPWPQPEIQAENFAAELLRLGATDVAPMLDLEGTILPRAILDAPTATTAHLTRDDVCVRIVVENGTHRRARIGWRTDLVCEVWAERWIGSWNVAASVEYPAIHKCRRVGRHTRTR
jgi:hypothetical protein